MSKQKPRPAAQRPEKTSPAAAPRPAATASQSSENGWLLLLAAVLVLTAVALSPMLQNQLTNWDDPQYVKDNPLLPGPDWHGIFTKPVGSNYHPLTIASLALNYQSSKLAPFGYFLVNWLLHIANTAFVFWLAFLLSRRNRWVAAATALFFGIHPMHVESVAWISERKDVLYTFFFLPSLIFYWKYLDDGKASKYAASLLLFAVSLLCKPAAVVLPVVLFLFDYFKGRAWTARVFYEKLPFFALALGFGWMALNIQAEKAIAKPEFYAMSSRFLFGCFGFVEYLRRLVWPGPLSSFHPFPPANALPSIYYAMPVLVAAVAAAAWYFRKNRAVVFGLGFFLVNVGLVLQFPITFGNCVIAERYTYVPYIGLVFMLAMIWADEKTSPMLKKGLAGLAAVAAVGFAAMTFNRVKVWHDTEALWTSVIDVYPTSHIARANRATFLIEKNQQDRALEDCNVALKTLPTHAQSLENRITIYLNKNQNEAALADGESLVAASPGYYRGYLLRGFARARLNQVDGALADYSKCIELNPNDHEAWGNRASLLFNSKNDFGAALTSFNRALELKPGYGLYLINRSKCQYRLGNLEEARKDLAAAEKAGIAVEETFKNALK